MAFLLEHLPPTLELVIASRSEPGLPLARLRARGELVEIDAERLRFSAEEAEALLNNLHGLALDRAEIAQLRERTEGWPAGLYLAALSLGAETTRTRSSERLRATTGTSSTIAWLDGLPSETVAADARLCLAEAATLLELGRVEEVDAWLDAAEGATARASPPEEAAALESGKAAYRVITRYMFGDVGNMGEAARRGLERISSAYWRSALLAILGASFYFEGRSGECSSTSRAKARSSPRRSAGGRAVPRGRRSTPWTRPRQLPHSPRDLLHAPQIEAQIPDPVEQAEELRLISHIAHEGCVPARRLDRLSVEGRGEAFAEPPTNGDPVPPRPAAVLLRHGAEPATLRGDP